MNIDTALRELGPVDSTALREAVLAQDDMAWRHRDPGDGGLYVIIDHSIHRSQLCLADFVLYDGGSEFRCLDA